MAPEILRYEKYDAKADLWHVGVVLYETPIPAPISKSVLKFKKSSLVPNGPFIITPVYHNTGEISNPGMVCFCSYNLSTSRYVS
jgi:hypothetical protein